MAEEYRWVVSGPLGPVALKQSTFDMHITDTTERSDAEISNLVLVIDAAKGIVQIPRFIYYDEDGIRHRYVDLISFPELNHLQGLVVVVDPDRDPHEVVTWMIKRDLKQERGELIYDARAKS